MNTFHIPPRRTPLHFTLYLGTHLQLEKRSSRAGVKPTTCELSAPIRSEDTIILRWDFTEFGTGEGLHQYQRSRESKALKAFQAKIVALKQKITKGSVG